MEYGMNLKKLLKPLQPLEPKALSPTTYQSAARCLRKIADALEARCKPKTPRQKAALTSTVYGLSRYAKALADRHRRTTKAE
jgi:hypothetical protein